MKRAMLTVFFSIFCAALVYGTVAAGLPPQQESPAYLKYEKRPKNELSKLIYLMDRFKGTDYKIVLDNAEYDSETALQYAKNYIAKHYRKEKAMDWIQQHSYRTPAGQMIYLKSPDGKSEMLRDALTQELKTLG